MLLFKFNIPCLLFDSEFFDGRQSGCVRPRRPSLSTSSTTLPNHKPYNNIYFLEDLDLFHALTFRENPSQHQPSYSTAKSFIRNKKHSKRVQSELHGHKTNMYSSFVDRKTNTITAQDAVFACSSPSLGFV